MSLRERILKKSDLKLVPFEVPEWGETVYIRSWTGKQRDDFEQKCLQDEKQKGTWEGLKIAVIVSAMSDENGNLLFKENETEIILEKSGAVLDRFWQEASKHLHILKEDAEELVKNSDAVKSGNSGTS